MTKWLKNLWFKLTYDEIAMKCRQPLGKSLFIFVLMSGICSAQTINYVDVNGVTKLYIRTGTSTPETTPGTLQFKSSTYSVSEDGSAIRVYVSRASGSDGAASVNYATANGTAIADTDYTAASGTLNWIDGNADDKYFDVTIIDNNTVGSSRNFTVGLSSASGASLGSITSTTITITEDDTASLDYDPNWPYGIGIPTPPFGINETYRMYDISDSEDPNYCRNPDLTYNPSDSNGYYTHYVDPDDEFGVSTDTGNPYGTKEHPRTSLPTMPLPAGSILEIHSGTFTSGSGSIFIKSFATEDMPTFIRGSGTGTHRFANKIRAEGTYMIIEDVNAVSCVIMGEYSSPQRDTSNVCVRSSNFNSASLGNYNATDLTDVTYAVFYNNMIDRMQDTNDILYTEYSTGDDNDIEIYGNNQAFQSFVTSGHSNYVTKISLKLYKKGNPGILTVRALTTSSSLPSTTSMGIGTIDANDFTTDTGGEWVDIGIVPSSTMSLSTLYAITLSAASGDADNCVYWLCDSSSPSYSNGASGISNDGGASWSEDSTKDLMFKQYGMYDIDATGVTVDSRIEQVWIIGNTIRRCRGSGILLIADNSDIGETSRYIYIGGNHVYDTWQAGIATKYCRDVVVSQNIVHDVKHTPWSPSKGLGNQYAPQNVWYLFNTVYNVTNPFRIASTDGGSNVSMYVIGNIFANSKYPQVDGMGEDVSYSNAWSGGTITVWGGSNRYFLCNTFYNNILGLYSPSGYGSVYFCNNIMHTMQEENAKYIFLDVSTLANNSVCEGNIFYDPNKTLSIEWGSSVSTTIEEFQAETTTGDNCLIADPLFVDAENNNFDLQAGSPALEIPLSSTVDTIADRFEELYEFPIRNYIEALFLEGVQYAPDID